MNPGSGHQARRAVAARVAPAPAAQPARPRARGRRVGAPPELPGDGPLAPERQIALTADAALKTLLDELLGYPGPEHELERDGPDTAPDLAVPLRLRGDAGELTFISTIATFGTAVEVTASELSIESFFPADGATAEAVRAYVE